MRMPNLPNCIGPVLDISGNNAPVDLAEAKARHAVKAVFMKATEGGDWRDKTFGANLQKAKTAGLPVGAYHFATARTASLQVANFIDTVTRAVGGLKGIVPVLDVEHNDHAPANTTTPQIADEWVRLFVEKTGVQPVIYAGAFLHERGGATPHMKKSPLWLAAYVSKPATITGWNDWTFWQYTDGQAGPYAGPVAGIGATCDQSVFRGQQADLDALWQAYA